MSTFQSDINKASTLATSLSNSVAPLNQGKKVQTAKSTTLQGNGKSVSLTGKEQALKSSFATALTRDIANIHSVASDFEVMSKELENIFNPIELGGKSK
ncbi:TIGR04197 family type VII secretion effector [Carnobacterium maltaromaticum]|uniref:TIGR04197 family type VII secretion effector n=1 Tax=Carnobacterium maltaromaticum TaxID=2751 RepID=A0AAW9JYB2_CARML|nr:TIGR04197 family type VII secretion effector [Carnobacterium maltaromaticum]MDZ5760538.1 TIGR04197 family type VII secretion effector [Carnobacterium maltaromaticum]